VPGALTLKELQTLVKDGAVVTVLLVMTDMQGRMQGKRLTAHHFLDEVVHHKAEGCNYLLAVDVEMRTVEGYRMSSWERDYGDFRSPGQLLQRHLATSSPRLTNGSSSQTLLARRRVVPRRNRGVLDGSTRGHTPLVLTKRAKHFDGGEGVERVWNPDPLRRIG